jgi:hypothetical protein
MAHGSKYPFENQQILAGIANLLSTIGSPKASGQNTNASDDKKSTTKNTTD